MQCWYLVVAAALVAHVKAGVPSEWALDEARLNLLYVADDSKLPPSQLPAIGNGYLATAIGSDAVFISGVYNGLATEGPSKRARLRSTVNFRAPGSVTHAALHLREATYYRRSSIPPFKDAWFGFAACGPWWANTAGDSCTSNSVTTWVEQRWYAHRVLRSVLVHEVEVIGDDSNVGSRMEARHAHGRMYRKAYASPAEITRSGEEIEGATNPRPLALLKLAQLSPPSGDDDFDWRDVTGDPSIAALGLAGAGSEWSVRLGTTRIAETPDVAPITIAVLTSRDPPNGNRLSVARSGFTYALLTVIKTSLEVPVASRSDDAVLTSSSESWQRTRQLTIDLVRAAHADYAAATLLASDGVLHATHVAAWAGIWRSGVEITGRRDVAATANASLYSLVSFARADWPFGSSPGGLSTGGYNGHQVRVRACVCERAQWTCGGQGVFDEHRCGLGTARLTITLRCCDASMLRYDVIAG